jgi:AraC-like DNA-binding protein
LAEIASVSADFDDGHVIPEHSHPEDQLLFASAGVMTLRTKHSVWIVPPLRAVWIPAETPHTVAMAGPVSMRTLYFQPRLCHALPRKCFVMNVSALLRELILHVCRFQRLRRNVSAERRVVEFVLEQLKSVECVPLQLPQPTDARALRVVSVLFENPTEERSLEGLCKDCGASKRTIQRLFLEETKMTFGKWRQQLRLLHGMQLLARGEKVTAAALESGYSSTSAFISMFRKELGTTPRRYLKLQPSERPSRRRPGRIRPSTR